MRGGEGDLRGWGGEAGGEKLSLCVRGPAAGKPPRSVAAGTGRCPGEAVGTPSEGRIEP